MTREQYFEEFDRRVEYCLAVGDRDGIEELYEQAMREGAFTEEDLDSDATL